MNVRSTLGLLLASSVLAIVSVSACGGSSDGDLFGPDVNATTPPSSAEDGSQAPDPSKLGADASGARDGAYEGGSKDASLGLGLDADTDAGADANGPVDGGVDARLVCAWKEHACAGVCVPENEGSCGPSCTPCATPPPPHMTASCKAGSCATSCEAGWVDCDGDAVNGCETDLRTSATSCGVCGHDCLGTACNAGVCGHTVLATLQGDPEDLAVDGTYVYWANKTAGTVVAAPKAGGVVRTLASGQDTPRGIALDDAYVYWTNHSNVGAVMRVAKAGGASTTVASGQYYPYRMAVNATTVYFTNDSTGGNLSSVPKTGGAVSVIAAAQSSPRGVVVDAAHVYWVSWQEAKSMPLGGGAITKVSYQEKFPFHLAADATTLFWHDGYAHKIRSSTKAGGPAQTVVTLPYSASSSGRQLAVDAESVYFTVTEQTADTIRRAAKLGGKMIVLGAASAPTGLAVDQSWVYYANQGDGSVRRVAK